LPAAFLHAVVAQPRLIWRARLGLGGHDLWMNFIQSVKKPFQIGRIKGKCRSAVSVPGLLPLVDESKG